MHCDNATIVDTVNTGTSKNRDILCLVRMFFFICVRFNFDMKLEHVPGVVNIAVDHLSRLDLHGFRAEFPDQYNKEPMTILRCVRHQSCDECDQFWTSVY